jgi:hypothetical protein
MIPEEVLSKFREGYAHVHPLVLQRSAERAKDEMDLFEILESVPKNPPFSWDDEKHSWVKDLDVYGKKQLKKMMSRK